MAVDRRRLGPVVSFDPTRLADCEWWIDGDQRYLASGGSRVLPGTAALFRRPMSTEFEIGAGVQYWSGWIYPTGSVLGTMIAVGTTQIALMVKRRTDRTLVATLYSGGVKAVEIVTANFAELNQWAFWECVHDGPNKTLYLAVNRGKYATGTYTGVADAGAGEMLVGAIASDYFEGSISRFYYYQRFADDDLRKLLWNEGQSRSYAELDQLAGGKDNLVAAYQLAEASGDAIDAHAGLDLARTGAPTAGEGVTTRMRQYTAGSEMSHDLKPRTMEIDVRGRQPFAMACWTNFDTIGANFVFSISDGVIPGAQTAFVVDSGDTRPQFLIYNDTGYERIIYPTSLEVGKQHFWLGWTDPIAEKIFFRLDDGAIIESDWQKNAYPTPLSVGAVAGGLDRALRVNFMNGGIGRTAFMKPPAGVQISNVIDDIHTRLWNGGDARHSLSLTEQELETWGIIQWDGDENVHGANAHSTQTRRAGHASKALNQGWRCPDNSWNLGTGDFSVEFMFRLESFSDTPYLVFNGATVATSPGILIYALSNGRLGARVADGSVMPTCVTDDVMDLNRWYHCAVNGNRAGNLELYLNAHLKDTADLTPATGNINRTFTEYLGFSGAAAPVNRWDGDLFAFRLRNRILTTTEITSGWNQGEGRKHDELSSTEKAGLMVSIDFDDRNQNVCIDYSGNQNNATGITVPTTRNGPTKNVLSDRSANDNDAELLFYDSAYGAWVNESPEGSGSIMVADKSGNNRHGVCGLFDQRQLNAARTNDLPTGVAGRSLKVNAGQHAATADFNYDNYNQLSVFTWAKDTGGGPLFALVCQYDVANDRSWMLGRGADAKLWAVVSNNGLLSDATAKQVYSLSPVWNDNQWHLVGFTFDAGTIKLYVDGVSVPWEYVQYTGTGVTTFYNSAAPVAMGCFFSAGNANTAQGWVGPATKTRVYNRVISDTEASQMVTGSEPGNELIKWDYDEPEVSLAAAPNDRNSLTFMGSAECAQVSSNEQWRKLPMSVEGWFKGKPGTGTLIGNYVNGSAKGWQLDKSGALALRFFYYVDGSNNIPVNVLTFGGLVGNVWQHVGATIDATGGKLYVDGLQVASVGWTGTPGASTQTQDGLLGSSWQTTSERYLPIDGLEHDFNIYDRVLTPAEMLARRNGGAPTTPTARYIGPRERGRMPANDLVPVNVPGLKIGPGTSLGEISSGARALQVIDKAKGHVFYQNTAAKQATWVEQVAAVRNRPGLLFDGTDDTYESDTAFVNFGPTGTLFCVAIADDDNTLRYSIDVAGTGLAGCVVANSEVDPAHSPLAIYGTGSLLIYLRPSSSDFDNLPHVLAARFTSTGGTMWLNGVQRAQNGTPANITPTAKSYLGSASGTVRFLKGIFLEGIEYRRVLSDPEITKVTNYLMQKYGIS